MSEVKYQITFSKEVQQAISELVVQYGLASYYDLALLERLEKEDPEIAIFNLAKRILNTEGRFKDISEILKKDLGMQQKEAEKMAYDIKDKVVVLAEELPEEKKETKIINSEPEQKESLPYDKKVEIKNVEENAKKMEQNLTDKKEEIISAPKQEELTKVKTVLPQEEKKGPDTYREPLE